MAPGILGRAGAGSRKGSCPLLRKPSHSLGWGQALPRAPATSSCPPSHLSVAAQPRPPPWLSPGLTVSTFPQPCLQLLNYFHQIN